MTDQTPMERPRIEADRLTLRPLQRSDQGLIEMFASDARVAKMTSSIPHPLPPGTTEAFLARAAGPKPDEMVWAMDASAQGGAEVLGLMSLKRRDAAQCEIGYWVAPAYWNTGTASDALHALLAANPMQCTEIVGRVFQDNPASAKVLTKAGFAYVGEDETYCVSRGANIPTWTYLRKLD